VQFGLPHRYLASVTGAQTLKWLWKPSRRVRGIATMRLGRVAADRPLSRSWGHSRGTPIDRHYIEAFLAERAGDIKGGVLEVGDDAYWRRFGGERVTRQDILHLKGHPLATTVGDLSQPGLLPEQSFDCIIFTQTLQFVLDMPAAINQLHGALRPGGALLATAPGTTPVGQGEWGPFWCWSVTENALSRLLGASFANENLSVRSYGNLIGATTFLHAAAAEEVGTKRLQRSNPAYPVIVAARAIA